MAMDIERFNFKKIFRDIQMHLDVGIKVHQSKRTPSDARFLEVFESLNHLLVGPIQEYQQKISIGCAKYDFVNPDGTPVKGNGYRSLLFLLSSLLQPMHTSLQKVSKDRGSMFFSSVDCINQLCVYCRALQGMEFLLKSAVYMMEQTPDSVLFAGGDQTKHLSRILCSEYICRDVFFGKMHGFQYAPTMRPLLYMISVGMASYEDWYNAEGGEPLKQLVASLWKGSKYVKNSTRRGLKLDTLTTDSSVYFVKAFWSLLEQDAIKNAMKVIGQSVEVRQLLEVPAKSIKMEGIKGEVEIEPSNSDFGYKPIPFLLLSSKWREGQSRPITSGRTPPLPPAKGLIIHMHGGGYVAQSPLSHEFYLRRWSNELETPIMSIDYTLAPEGPFPRALDECVLAYVWALQNKHLLGTTAESVILVGDSAGGNFSLTVAMKLKQLGLRMPNSILAVYPTTNSTSDVCPSRILAVVDPILPIGIMQACQQAYTGQLASPELIKMRQEYRQKIFKAKGYYLPDPDQMSSSLLVSVKNGSGRRATIGSSPGTSRSSTAGPPERPPPPSEKSLIDFKKSKNVGVEADDIVTDSKRQYRGYNRLEDIDLIGAEDEEEQENDDEKSSGSVLTSLPMTMLQRRDPAEKDKLSEQEIEELISEVMKAYDCPENTKNPFMSPMLASADMLTGLPPVHIVGAALDPILDDSVAMAQKLKSAGQRVTLDIVQGLPHGFLCMMSLGNNTDLNNAHSICLVHLKKALGMSPLLKRGSSRRMV